MADKLLTTEEKFTVPPADKKSKAQQVRSDFTEAKSARRYKDSQMLEQYKIYRFQGSPPKAAWRSKTFIPRGHVNVVVKTARTVTAILSSDPFFKAVASNQPYVQNEEAVENLMMQQHEDMDFTTFLHDWILDYHIFPAAIAKMYWKYDEEIETVETTEMQPIYADIGGQLIKIGEEPKTVKKQERKVLFDGPMAEVVNIFDFYPDPKATSVKTARYVIHRREVTIDHLDKMARIGVYDKAAVNAIRNMNATSATDSGEKQEIQAIEGGETDGIDLGNIEILEHWTRKTKRVVGPNDTMLQEKKNVFKRIPFFDIKHLRSGHKFWGVGVNESSTTIQDSMNTFHRMKEDNWQIALQRMFVVDMQAIFSPSDLVARPGGYVRTKGGYDTKRAITQLDMPQIPIAAYAEQEYLERLDEISTGVTDSMRGTDAPTMDETATKTRMTAAGSGIRFGVELLLLEPALKDLLLFQHELNQLFLDMPRVVRTMGDAGYQYPLVGPEQIEGQMRFNFELSPVQGNREAWLQRIMLVFQQFSNNPYIAPQTGWLELGRRLLKAADIRNPGMILNEQNLMQNAMMMPPEQLGMMQMMGGGGAGPNQQQSGPATNPEVGRMNAITRSPQQTPNDMYRDQFAKAG